MSNVWLSPIPAAGPFVPAAESKSNSTQSSERALDATAFFLADVADGLGPFLVIYLTSQRNWSSGEASLAMSMMLVGTVLSQTFVGAWIDQTRFKRFAVAASAILVAASSIAMYYLPTRDMIYCLQFTTGIAVAIFPPALAAISLGLVGRQRLPFRAGRNEACFHAGNVVSAGLAIVGSWLFGNAGAFYVVAGMACCSAIGALLISASHIDHQAARGADEGADPSQVMPWLNLFQDRRILLFTLAVVLFHFANAAMLPLLGQKIGAHTPGNASALMAACIIVAQLTMVPVAIFASRAAVSGRRPVFLIGFAILPLRGLICTFTDNSYLLIANQILDGVGAGIFGVTALLVMADLTRGTGRFNFAQGIVATAIGLGAALSNAMTGRIVDAAGFNAGFYFLSAVAVVSFIVFVVAVPETVGELQDKESSPFGPREEGRGNIIAQNA